MRTLLLTYKMFDKIGREPFHIDNSWQLNAQKSLFLYLNHYAYYLNLGQAPGEMPDTFRRIGDAVYWEMEIWQDGVMVTDYLHPAAVIDSEDGNFMEVRHFYDNRHPWEKHAVELKEAVAPAQWTLMRMLGDYERGRWEPGGTMLTAPCYLLPNKSARVPAAYVNRNIEQLFIPRRP